MIPDSLCEKHCALLMREALGGRLFGVRADLVVSMLRDVDASARVVGKLEVIEALTRGGSLGSALESVKVEADAMRARFEAQRVEALK